MDLKIGRHGLFVCVFLCVFSVGVSSLNYCTENYITYCLNTRWLDNYQNEDWFNLAQYPIFTMTPYERERYCTVYLEDSWNMCLDFVLASCVLESEADDLYLVRRGFVNGTDMVMRFMCEESTASDYEHFWNCLARSDVRDDFALCKEDYDITTAELNSTDSSYNDSYCSLYTAMVECFEDIANMTCGREAAKYVVDSVNHYWQHQLLINNSCTIDLDSNIDTACNMTTAAQCLSSEIAFMNDNHGSPDCNNIEVNIAKAHGCMFEYPYNCPEQDTVSFYSSTEYVVTSLMLNYTLERCILNTYLTTASIEGACDSWLGLSDIKRSTGYSLDINEASDVCDTDVDEATWYRFTADTGYEIPESVDLSEGQCGTQYPMWMSSAHPRVFEFEEDADHAYDAYMCMTLGSNTCFLQHKIRVMNCPDTNSGARFFIYNLKQMPSCMMSYCAGTCQEDYIWNTVLEQCQSPGSVPQLVNTPSITANIVNNSLVFTCDTGYPLTSPDDGARFDVSWFINSVDLNMPQTVRSDEGNGTLDGDLLQGHIGEHVPNNIVINERDTEPVTVTLSSTFPIICEDCVVISVNSSESIILESCTLEQINSTDFQMRIKAERTIEKKIEDYTTTLTFTINGNEESMFTGYSVPNLQVEISDRERGSLCHVGGPLVSTFDETHYYLTADGYYKLWEAEARNFKAYVEKSNPSHICGITIQEGDVVYKVDVCNGLYPVTDLSAQSVSQEYLSSHLGIDSSGKIYKILLPSSAYFLIIVADSPELEIVIYAYAPSEDFGGTTGLCGIWDGNTDNDEDINNQRITIDEYCSLSDASGTISTDHIFCECTSGSATCDSTVASLANFNSVVPQNTSCSSSRELLPSITGTNEWPTNSGLTELNATYACQDAMQNSVAYQSCQNIVNMTYILALCMDTIQVTDTLNGTYIAVNTMEQLCIFEIQTNITVGSENELTAEDTLNGLVESVCPAQCSGRGQCSSGQCICDSGYIGSDCALQSGQAPIVWAFQEEVFDVQMEATNLIRIYGHGFWNSGQLQCKFRNVILSEDGDHTTEDNFTVASANFNSAYEIICDVPTTAVSASCSGGYRYTEIGLQVSVTTDGENFSMENLIIIYNSTCRSCDESGICSMLSGTCRYDGICQTGATCDDPCIDHTDIGNPRRSTNYSVSAEVSPNLLCDQIGIGNGNWYRFDQYSGGVMPETCVETYHCSTISPIWMDGTHPTALDPGPTSVSVCGNKPTDIDTDCCDWSDTIQVKYCILSNEQSYYVYQLTPVPECEMAYCSGTGEVCLDGFGWDYDTESCQDIDECLSSPCQNDGNCTEAFNNFSCSCQLGFTGILCETDIDDCEASSCANGAACVDGVNSFSCNCEAGYTGDTCQTDIDDCAAAPCHNNGSCVDSVNAFSCQCQDTFTGPICQFGVWAAWSAWTTCSTSCGYGYSSTTRDCGSTAECTGESVQYDLCTLSGCQNANPDDDEEGVIVTIAYGSLLSAIVQEQTLVTTVVDALSDFVQTHDLCLSLEFESISTVNNYSLSVITIEDIDVEYMMAVEEDPITARLQIIATIQVSQITAYCYLPDQQSNIPERVYFTESMINTALNNYIDIIEEATGIEIISIQQVSDLQSQTQTPSEARITAVPIIVAGTIFATVAVMIVICISRGIYKSKFDNKTRKRRTMSKVSIRPINEPETARTNTPASIFSASHIRILDKDNRPFSGNSARSGWSSRPLSSKQSNRTSKSMSLMSGPSRPMSASSSMSATTSIIPPSNATSISTALNPRVTSVYEGIASNRAYNRRTPGDRSRLLNTTDIKRTKTGLLIANTSLMRGEPQTDMGGMPISSS